MKGSCKRSNWQAAISGRSPCRGRAHFDLGVIKQSPALQQTAGIFSLINQASREYYLGQPLGRLCKEIRPQMKKLARLLLTPVAFALTVLGFACSLSAVLYAALPQTPAGPPAATPSPTPSSFTAEEKISAPEVVECIDSGKGTRFYQHITMNLIVERGDSVTVPIAGLKEWASERQADHDPNSLRLFLAGHLLPDEKPSGIQIDQGYINFQLTTLSANADERKAWTELLSEARRHEGGRVSISVGLPKNLQPFKSLSYIGLRVYPVYTPYVAIGLAILLVALVVLAWRTDLLRDTSRGKPPKPATAPFSLGRMQMAWWFYLVIAAYVYICLITKDVNGLSATVLGLIGISA